MATNTTNYSLVKPAYDDAVDVADINGNMDKVDTALNGLGKGFAVISNNNTHAALSAGQYVYIRNHGSLSEGLYTANSALAANATLTSSNVTAVSGGLGGAVSSLSNRITSQSLSNVDLNSINTQGHYSIASPVNPPASSSYCQLYVLETGFTWILQVFITVGEIYYRAKANSSSTWNPWVRVVNDTDTSVTSTSLPSVLPTVIRNASTATVEFALQLPSGTYGNGVWKVSPAPANTVHFTAFLGSDPILLRILSSGNIDFNSSITTTSSKYLIGHVTYPI